MSRRSASRAGVTLVETVLAVSIIGLLTSLTIPAVQQLRERAARAACQNSLRQIAIAAHSHATNHGPAPVVRESWPGGHWPIDQSMTWFTRILPELGYEAVWHSAASAYATTNRLEVDPPHSAQRAVIQPFRCGADDRLSSPMTDSTGVTASFTSFVGVAGNLPFRTGRITPNGVMAPNGLAVDLVNIPDGTSQTLLVGERPPDDGLLSGWWYRYHAFPGGPDVAMFTQSWGFLVDRCRQTGGSDGILAYHFGPGLTSNPCDRHHFWSLHPGGANFAFADGSVRFLPYSAVHILPALGSRDGGEVVAVPD
jgi:prepilin-type processing-associated H-X9-DG protein